MSVMGFVILTITARKVARCSQLANRKRTNDIPDDIFQPSLCILGTYLKYF